MKTLISEVALLTWTTLLLYISKIEHDICCCFFSETWLNPANFDDYGIVGSIYVGLTRGDRLGGGVSLLISEKLIYAELKPINNCKEII